MAEAITKRVPKTVRTSSGLSLEVFESAASGFAGSDEPEITIMDRGSLSINRAAAEALGRPRAIQLMFSEEERIMGIRAAEAGPGSFSLRPQGRQGSTHQTSGKSFLSWYGIVHERSTRYKGWVDDEAGVILVDLKAGGRDVSVPRKPKRAQK